MRVRKGDNKETWYRSERCYHTNEGWWISTREQVELGPFNSQEDASIELCLYIRKINMDNYQIAS